MIIKTSFNRSGIKRAIKKHIIIGILSLILSLSLPFFLSGNFILFFLPPCLVLFLVNLAGPLTLIPLYRKNPKDVNIIVTNNQIMVNETPFKTTIHVDNIKNFKEYDIGDKYAFNQTLWMPLLGYINPIYIELYSNVIIRIHKSNIEKRRFVISDNENHDLLRYISNQFKRRNYKR